METILLLLIGFVSISSHAINLKLRQQYGLIPSIWIAARQLAKTISNADQNVEPFEFILPTSLKSKPELLIEKREARIQEIRKQIRNAKENPQLSASFSLEEEFSEIKLREELNRLLNRDGLTELEATLTRAGTLIGSEKQEVIRVVESVIKSSHWKLPAIWMVPTSGESERQDGGGQSSPESSTDTRIIWNPKSAEWHLYVGSDGKGDLNRLYQSDPVLWELLGSVAGKTVLDIGCGNGYLSRQLSRAGASVVAIDFSEAMIKIAEKQSILEQIPLIYRVDDGCNLTSVPDETIDHIVSNYVLMDCPNLEACVASMYRVLKPGGTAVVVILHPAFSLKYRDCSISRWEKSYFKPHEQVIPPIDRSFSSNFTIFHRPFETYSMAFEKAKFRTEKIREPHLKQEQKELLDPKLIKAFETPISFAFLLKKPGPETPQAAVEHPRVSEISQEGIVNIVAGQDAFVFDQTPSRETLEFLTSFVQQRGRDSQREVVQGSRISQTGGGRNFMTYGTFVKMGDKREREE